MSLATTYPSAPTPARAAPSADVAPVGLSLSSQGWEDTRWLGGVCGQTSTPDVLAGLFLLPQERRAISRIYAAACADLAQATLGGLPPHSADWERWFAALRVAARDLSPARGNPHVVARALNHGGRLEGRDAPWACQLRRGFAALLAASVPEPVPALIGEDLAAFRAADTVWLARHPASADGTAASGTVLTESQRTGPSAPQYADTVSQTWPVATLRPNPLQPRRTLDPTGIDDLAASIVAHASQGGILQPLLVTGDGTVVAGHRRLAAARQAGLLAVPVIVRDLTPAQQLELLLVENLQRQDLSPLEEARGYQRLLDEGYTQAAVARAVGISAFRVASRLVLLDLDPHVQERVHRGELPVGVAPVLLPVRDAGQQRRLATLAVRRRLSVAQVRRLVDQTLGPLRSVPSVSPPTSLELLPDDDPADSGLSPTREALIAALRGRPDHLLTFADLAAVAEATCCACGLASSPAICDACPLADLLRSLITSDGGHAR